MDEAHKLTKITYGEACYVIDRPHPLERLTRWLFPWKHLESPEIENGADCLITRTTITFSFVDRLKILFVGRAMFLMNVAVKQPIGDHKVSSIVFPLRPKFMEEE